MEFLKYLLRPSWRTMAFAVMVAIAGAGYKGYTLGNNSALVEEWKATVADRDHTIYELQEKVKFIASVLDQDANKAQSNAEELAKLTEKKDALEKQISPGTCFSGDDVDRLREFWSAPIALPGPGAPRSAKGLLSYRPWGHKDVPHKADGGSAKGGNVSPAGGAVGSNPAAKRVFQD